MAFSVSAARDRYTPCLATLLAMFVAPVLAACEGCRSSHTPSAPNPVATADGGPPTLRLYLLSDVAGALEPCGCVKDQLGGLDHMAAWMASEKRAVNATMTLAAGPLFFMDPELKAE